MATILGNTAGDVLFVAYGVPVGLKIVPIKACLATLVLYPLQSTYVVAKQDPMWFKFIVVQLVRIRWFKFTVVQVYIRRGRPYTVPKKVNTLL